MVKTVAMQVVKVVAEQLLDAMEGMRGVADSHYWVAEVPDAAQVPSLALPQCKAACGVSSPMLLSAART